MPTESISIQTAQSKDLSAILNLLKQADLPLDGVTDSMDAFVAKLDQTTIGFAALERYETEGLLRSVVVHPQHRGKYLGQQLTKSIIELAREKALKRLYLLTETAGSFFPKLGFQTVNRNEVPNTIQNSSEFKSICPSSALVMELVL